MRLLWQFLAGCGLLVVLDLFWLGLVMKGFYQRQLGALMAPVKLLPGLLVWVLIAVGIILFAVPKASSVGGAAVWGAAFGLILYGVYELTNYALVAKWPLPVVFVDLVWGAFLCAAVASVAFLLR